MTYVKVCGLLELEHVDVAVRAGANFIGFVFAPSKRQISVEKAQHLAAQLPAHVKKVGVFVNADAAHIKNVFTSVPLDYVQYHGDETNAFIQTVGLPAIKAFSVREDTNFDEVATFDVDYYLMDAPGTDFRGGSGHSFDWALLDGTSIAHEKVILAGGLTCANVRDAIAQVQPFAVDVSSGVELEGRKDSILIKQFIEEVKGAKQK